MGEHTVQHDQDRTARTTPQQLKQHDSYAYGMRRRTTRRTTKTKKHTKVKTKMKTIQQAAEEYEKKSKPTIDALGTIQTSVEILFREETNMDNEKYDYYYVVEAGVEHRVPASVLTQLKDLSKTQDFTSFQVLKTGEGKLTKYQVAPLNATEKKV